MSLVSYRAKRNFTTTGEPKGKKSAPPKVTKAKRKSSARPRNPDSSRILFVIQKHAASHLHYDFRLELHGVLKSWAVPKGLPTVKGDKRLAVQVEDHPVEYANFEGTIPPGNYGAGTVMLWDAGLAEIPHPQASLTQGKLDLYLEGQKLKGHWAMVRIQPRREEKNPAGDSAKPVWLLIKTESNMRTLSAREEDRSVQSGRSMKQISQAPEHTWQSNRSESGRKATRK